MSHHNLITDVAGLAVGHADDRRLASGVTVILVEHPNVAAVATRGGAPGGRDTGLLEPEMTVQGVDAVILSGGSAFGLDAAGGVMSALRERGIGVSVGAVNVPIVTQAIVFDLVNGGDKDWGARPPYWDLGREAALAAKGQPFALGSVGGGHGATTANLKGGIGSASVLTESGIAVGAIAVVNAVGCVTVGEGPEFWAAPVEVGEEFGGLGSPRHVPAAALTLRMKGGAPPSTTIALVATDAILTKAQAKRVALMADDGLGRAIRPSHAPMDGDTVFAVATQRKALAGGRELADLTAIGQAAADCLARAVARGVYEATGLSFPGALPSWRDRFGALAGKGR